jgi:hypothetical protein
LSDRGSKRAAVKALPACITRHNIYSAPQYYQGMAGGNK